MRGYLIAVAAAIAVIVVAPIDTRMNTSPRLDKIDESLVAFNGALLNMQKNTDGALERMLESIDALSGNLADTKVATQSQITDMRDSIEAVKLVATTLPPQDPQIGDVIPDEDDKAPAPTPFATLDVNSSSDIRALADRVAALERQVDDLQVLKSQYKTAPATGGGSTGTLSTVSVPTYSTVTTTYSGGSTGSLSSSYYAPVYSEPVQTYSYSYTPTYSYTPVNQVSRRGLFGRRVYSSSPYSTCRVVNGQVVCQ